MCICFDLGSVTLMGHGYGAASVNLLMLSPVAQGSIKFSACVYVYACVCMGISQYNLISIPMENVYLVLCIYGVDWFLLQAYFIVQF